MEWEEGSRDRTVTSDGIGGLPPASPNILEELTYIRWNRVVGSRESKIGSLMEPERTYSVKNRPARLKLVSYR